MKTLLKTLAIFCLGAFALVGCVQSGGDDNGGGSTSKLLLVADKSNIYDNGEDCVTFTLYYEGMTLTEGYEIYIGENPLTGNTFSSTEKGTYTAWATYGTVQSNDVSINVVATPPAAPTAPEDTNPEKTNFKRRVFLTQFTGTGCQYCPLMMNALYAASQGTLANDFIIAAAHIGDFAGNDPARLEESKTLDDAMGVRSYPYLVTDLNKYYQDEESLTYDGMVENMIKGAMQRVGVKGGIAVKAEYHADEEYIVLNATVKAKETTEFRIGAWLLEDGIKATQQVANIQYSDGSVGKIRPYDGVDFNTHHNCVRIADSKMNNNDFSGHYLGTIEAGKTASREFAFKLKSNGTGGYSTWNHNNLRVIVFISTKEGNNWFVNNVVKCPKDGSVDFEYEE